MKDMTESWECELGLWVEDNSGASTAGAIGHAAEMLAPVG